MIIIPKEMEECPRKFCTMQYQGEDSESGTGETLCTYCGKRWSYILQNGDPVFKEIENV